MLLIWGEAPKTRILETLSPVLRLHPNLPYTVCNKIDALPPLEGVTLLLVLGDGPHAVLSQCGCIPKKRTVTSLRHTLRKLETGTPVLFTYSCGVGQVDYAKHIDLLTDVGSAMRFMATGNLYCNLDHFVAAGSYRWVPDFSELWTWVQKEYAKTGKPLDLSYDLETLGTDEFHPNAFIVSIHIGYKKGHVDSFNFLSREHMQEKARDVEFVYPLAKLLTSPMVSMRMANGKFDCRWTPKHLGIEVTNFNFDTMLVGGLLDENRSNALDIHAKVYLPEYGGYSDEFDATTDKSRMDKVDRDKLLVYGSGDADVTRQIAKVQKGDLLKDRPLTRFYINLLHPAARAYEMVERCGVLVDQARYEELRSDLTSEIARLGKEARKLIGGLLVASHTNVKTGKFNLTKPALLCDFMFSPKGLNLKPRMFTDKTKEPSTAIDHLLMFHDVPEAKEFVAVLKEYSSASKVLSTYVGKQDANGVYYKGFLSHLRSDGRFHPSYFLYKGDEDNDAEGGTVTGRLSAKAPAFQTIPKHSKWGKLLRRCFIAPEGMLILSNDYSQGELRVIACLANEEAMIEAYRNNMDLHALTAGGFRGYDYAAMMQLAIENPDLFGDIRQLGKAGNFGLIYGMQETGFRSYAYFNYGVALREDEAAAFRNGFFGRYPRLLDYHDQQTNVARLRKEVRSPLGRVRHLPLIDSKIWLVKSKEERRAINSPTQATLSDMSLLATAEAYKRGWHRKAPVFGMVHDQLLTYVPEDSAHEHARNQKELMENLPLDKFGWFPQLKFLADCELGPSLGELKKLKF